MLSNHPTYKLYEDGTGGGHSESPIYGKLVMHDPAQPSRQQLMQPYNQHHSPTRHDQGSIHATYKGGHHNENMNIINKNGGALNIQNNA
jgi:hypothetical protein